MEDLRKPFARALAATYLYFALAIEAIGAGIYLWLQPRGFTFGSRGFVEHEVIPPAFLGVTIAVLIAMRHRPRVALLGIGILAGFWVAVAGAVVTRGTTPFAKAMGLFVAFS